MLHAYFSPSRTRGSRFLTCVRRQVARAHREQRTHNGEERNRVDEEHPRRTDGRDQHAHDRGACDARRVRDRTVQRDRVREPVASHHLLDERVARRLVDDRDEAERERQREHHPYLDDVGEHDEPEHDGQQGCAGLRQHEDAAPVESIDDRATPQSEQRDREKAEREGRADRGAAAGEGEDQPRFGHRLHPGTDERDEFAAEVEAEVASVERTERPPHRSSEPDGREIRGFLGGQHQTPHANAPAFVVRS